MNDDVFVSMSGEQRQLGQRVRWRQNEDCQPVRTLSMMQLHNGTEHDCNVIFRSSDVNVKSVRQKIARDGAVL
jgi:hypothetical protein